MTASRYPITCLGTNNLPLRWVNLNRQSSLRNQLRTTYLIFEAWEGGFHKLQPVNLALILESTVEHIIKGMLIYKGKWCLLRDSKGSWKCFDRNTKVTAPGNLCEVQKTWPSLSWSKVFVNKKEKWVQAGTTGWIRNWIIAYTQIMSLQCLVRAQETIYHMNWWSLEACSRLQKTRSLKHLSLWNGWTLLTLLVLHPLLQRIHPHYPISKQ